MEKSIAVSAQEIDKEKGERPFLILVTGLRPDDGKSKEMIRAAFLAIPNSSVTFIDRPWVRNIIPVLDHYDLILCTHPALIKHIFPGPFDGWEKLTHGWWKTMDDVDLKYYSTSEKLLEGDLRMVVQRYVKVSEN